MNPKQARWDVIVVGCGVMGAATSYNLAKRGLKVLTLDRFGLNHRFGSSHGQTRIIRLAYYEDPRYVPLLRRAWDAWREVEAESGNRLLLTTGGLMIGRPDSELVTGVLRSAKAHSLAYEMLSPKDLRERFGQFALGDEYCGVYEGSAGVLFAEDAVKTFVGLAGDEGCQFRFQEQVMGWKASGEGIQVETAEGTETGERLVLCAGPWNGDLVGGTLPLKCERQVPFWFPTGKDAGAFSPEKMPVWIMEEDPGIFYYGIPDVGRGVKVARTHGGEFGSPDSVRREVAENDVRPVREFVSRRLRNLGTVPLESQTCIYTNTPDLNFVLGHVPGAPGVILVSACSGHGFKFASVIGEVATALALGEEVGFDISFLSPRRF